jgi:hypothetical protein
MHRLLIDTHDYEVLRDDGGRGVRAEPNGHGATAAAASFDRAASRFLSIVGAEYFSMALLHRFQHLLPAFGGGDDVSGIGFPEEGLRALVVLLDERVDRLAAGRRRNGRHRARAVSA